MADLDRDKLVELLDRLGDADDAVVLAAARDASSLAMAAGLSWDVLLRRSIGEEDDDQSEPDEEVDEQTVDAAELAGDRRLIEDLLARGDLSDDFRDELVDLRQALDEGEFTAMDSRYLRAVAKRVGG